MGFFDNVFKAVNKAKEMVENIQDIANSTNASKPSTPSTSSQKPAEAVPFTPETISVVTPDGIASRECKTTIFDCTEEADYEIEVSMSIDNRFHEFNSGAGEFDVTYLYAPDYKENSNDSLEWESGTPCIFIGFNQDAYDIAEAFNKGKSLPANTTLKKIEGNDKILYKTTHSKFNEKYVLYHFKRGVDHKILHQIGASIPEKLVGTPLEQIVLDAADLMVTTHLETIVNKTLVVK